MFGSKTVFKRYEFPRFNNLYIINICFYSTDGSYSQLLNNAGAGISSNIFSFYSPAGTSRTAFDGEIKAIRTAL